MPLRNSYGFSNPGIINGGDLHPESKLEKAYRYLLLVRTVLHITYWFAAGMFLMLLPSQRFWDNNALLLKYPDLRSIVVNPFLKGAIFGLGLANLIIGVRELFVFANSRQK